MNLIQIIEDLRRERGQIEESIVALERLAAGRGKRRGRPPAWMAQPKKRGRPPGKKAKAMVSAEPQ